LVTDDIEAAGEFRKELFRGGAIYSLLFAQREYRGPSLRLQEERTKALQSLCALLRSEEGIPAAQGLAPKLWPQMLSLLRDPGPAVRQNAAIAVGLVGAVASRPPLVAGTFPGDTIPRPRQLQGEGVEKG